MAKGWRPLASSPAQPSSFLPPSKAVANCDGKDIVKRGHRKTKFLFAFPGLVTFVAGGRFGELAHLDSKYPVLYVDFPQGRLKLFGEIVYPENKYLTLHFQRGAGNILCEDWFETLVVFSTAWWIGTKEENPEEKQLQMPTHLNKKQENGAESNLVAPGICPGEQNLPGAEKGDGFQDQEECPDGEEGSKITGSRLSARTSNQRLSYVEMSSDEDMYVGTL